MPTRVDVENLDSPAPINKLMSQNVAVGLLKDYVEGIANQDSETLKNILEPSFY